MKKLFLMTLLAFSLAMAGLAAQDGGEKITVKVGETKAIGDVSIKFLSVLEDSRCPVGTNCIWAGNAKVELEIGKESCGAKKFELNSNMEPQKIEYNGKVITIADLTPRPAENVKIERNGYILSLDISQAAVGTQ